MVWRLQCGSESMATTDIYDHQNLTLRVAHDYVNKNFNDLSSGQVIDVQFILGETAQAKPSERESQ